MICEACHGEGWIKKWTDEGGLLVHVCLDCMGSGIASCCDTAGSPYSPHHVASYRDDTFPPRKCDYCGQEYRGPAVYCSLECATDDI
jgi:hypothetical protein